MKDRKILSTVEQLKKIDDGLNNVLSKNAETISRLENEVSEAKLKAEKAERDLASAADNANVDGFRKAKEQYNDASDEIDLKKLMIDRKKTKPLLNDNVASINKETMIQLFNNMEKYCAEKVYSLLEQAEEIRRDCITVSEIARQMGRKLENEIMHQTMGISDFYPPFLDRYQIRGLETLKSYVENNK